MPPTVRLPHGVPLAPQPAVFLDRDGTLIEDDGHLAAPAQVRFFSETVPALERLQPHFKLFIVTNQSGIAKREITEADASRVNTHVVHILRDAGIAIAAVYCCPHQRADGCACIKPNRYFADVAARQHGVDLARSYAVGDHPHDVAFGRRMGGTGLYVLTGHGQNHRADLPGSEVVVDHIGAAADWILNAQGLKLAS